MSVIINNAAACSNAPIASLQPRIGFDSGLTRLMREWWQRLRFNGEELRECSGG
jgi:hypothetical protein